MARKVFFSFHFKRDAWRAGQVRNTDMLADEDEYGVIDAVEWEKIKQQGKEVIARWINDQLKYTSVTVVLIGAETAEREWVDYEIRQSWERGNAIVGVRIHNMLDQNRQTDTPGANPLDQIMLADDKPLSSIFKTYDWVSNDGRNNLGQWVEEAYNLRQSYSGDTKLKPEIATTPAQNAPVTATAFTPRSPWSDNAK